MNLMDTIRPTNWLRFEEVNRAVGAEVHFASETKQVTHSFKYRAASSVVQNIDAVGFLAASSGNFGQALACACHRKGVPCIIVMPTTSAKIKVDAVRSHNATVVFVDTRVQTRADKVAEIAISFPEYYIASAYDCDKVILGNSTLGDEIALYSEVPDLVLVPVGGGGLISGISLAFERRNLNLPIWGAEPEMADDAYRSFKMGRRMFNEGEPQTLADGARTQSVGQLNWEIMKRRVSGIKTVSERSIKTAMKLLHSVGHKVEPTGALTLGSLLENPPKESRIVAVISGGNVDSSVYKSIIG